jgi:hypothetical protein
MAIDLNPYHICTWDDASDCETCKTEGNLACKWDAKILGGFIAISIPPGIITVITMILLGLMIGAWWLLPAFIGYIVVVLLIFEIKALCSHCPYYARSGLTLKCLGNNGALRIWKYDPKPISSLERFWFWGPTVTGTFFIWPIAVQAYGIWYLVTNYSPYGLIPLVAFIGLTVANLMASLTFLVVLRTFFCSRCINFSCTFNTVPKEVVDAYLEKNPVMREAWEQTGYKLG